MNQMTSITVRALRPDPGGKDVFAWDSGDGALKGFGVRVKPSATASYFVQYRNKEGRTRRMVLGRVGEAAIDEARRNARICLLSVRFSGSDPSAERQIKNHQGAYNSWRAMQTRCIWPSHKNFKNYGGRGIKICKRWRHNFWAFLEEMGDRPEGHSLDRKNPYGHYEPGNCRWANPETQRQNTRKENMKGQTF